MNEKPDHKTFKLELFEEQTEYEECPLRDRKAEVKIWREDAKAEFIRDVIALSNTARLLGKPAYLLLGIADNTDICGIKETQKYYCEEKGYPENKFWEEYQKTIGSVIFRYIKPHLPFDFKHELYKKGVPIAYLLIKPIPSRIPFQVKRDFPKKTRRKESEIFEGQIWLRFGESKQEIEKSGRLDYEQAPVLFEYVFTRTPYLLPNQWKIFFEKSIKEHNKAASIIGYQDVQTMQGDFLNEIVEKLLGNDDVQMIFLRGAAGCGKTAYLERLVSDHVSINLEEIEDIIKREDFSIVKGWVPLYFSLRHQRISSIEEFGNKLAGKFNEVSRIWGEWPENPERLFEIENLNWLICLDGLDEIWDEEARWDFLGVLRSFADRHRDVKFILTSRPIIAEMFDDWHDRGVTVDIAPLTSKKIENYIAANVSIEYFDEALTFLQSDDDLWKLASRPVYLEAALTELSESLPEPLEDTEGQSVHQESASSFSRKKAHRDEEQTEGAKEFFPVENYIKELVFENDQDTPIGEPEYTSKAYEPNNDEDNDDIFEAKDKLEIRLGVFVNDLYNVLWKREENRASKYRPFSSLYWERTSKLAVETLGNRDPIYGFSYQDALDCYCHDKALFWVLDLGVLEEKANRLLKFYSTLTQTYFASKYLETRIKLKDIRAYSEYLSNCSENFRDQTLNILSDLVPNLDNLVKEV